MHVVYAESKHNLSVPTFPFTAPDPYVIDIFFSNHAGVFSLNDTDFDL
jgi:hypothetical protein